MKPFARFAAFLALGVSALASEPVPRSAKEFEFVEPGGKHTLLSSYKGKVVVIQFLLDFCPHCQAMSRDVLTKLQTSLGPRGLQALGVVYNDPDPTKRTTKPEMAQNYQAGNAPDGKKFSPTPLNFPIAYASRDTINSFLGASVMDRLMFPQVVVIDKKGQIRAQSEVSGTAQLQNEAYLTSFINDLLKESATSAAPKKSAAVTAAATK
jgi:thiol-disulfide isomerase/thioredoxin